MPRVEIRKIGNAATTTQGDIIVRGAANNERLAVGSEGQTLKVVSGVPAWAGEKNYVTNQSAATAITGWVYSDIDLTVTRTTTASELPIEFTTGTGIKIEANSGDPTNDYVYYDFTLDAVDLNKKLKIQWAQKQFGTYGASDFEVYIAAQSARSTILHTPDVTFVPAYDGVFTASFNTASTAALSLVIRAREDMLKPSGLVISNVVVGPGTIVLVSTGTQSFAGNKTFTGNVALGGLRVGIATESGGAGTYAPDVTNVGAYVFAGGGIKTVNTINGGVDGKVLFLIQQASAGNTLLITNAGNIRTASGATVTLTNNGGMLLVYQNGGWQEISSGL